MGRATAVAAMGPLAAVLLAACSGSGGLLPVAGGNAPHPPTPTPTAPSPSPSPAPRAFTLAVTGDILVHDAVASRARASGRASGQAFDFRPMLSEVAPLITAADLAVCHLETPLSPDNRDLAGYPRFNAPRQVAEALAASGFDACSTASNHALDRGAAGVGATLDVLDAAGLDHAGTARTRREAGPSLYRIPAGSGPVTVGHLSSTYGLNGQRLPADRPYLVNVTDRHRILADARRARRSGAGFVVVSLHWGAEYRHEPTPEQEILARNLVASPAIDLLIGHHAHVVQPLARIGGGYVAFGLGNFLSAQGPHCCPAATRDGVVLRFSVVEGPQGIFTVQDITFAPTWVEPSTYRVLPAAGRAAPGTPAATRRALARSSARTTRVLISRGVAATPAAWAPVGPQAAPATGPLTAGGPG